MPLLHKDVGVVRPDEPRPTQVDTEGAALVAALLLLLRG